MRLGEPWYFTKSNEHVSQHCSATIGLFEEEPKNQVAVTPQGLFTCSLVNRACLALSVRELKETHRGSQVTHYITAVLISLYGLSPRVLSVPTTKLYLAQTSNFYVQKCRSINLISPRFMITIRYIFLLFFGCFYSKSAKIFYIATRSSYSVVSQFFLGTYGVASFFINGVAWLQLNYLKS